MKEPNLEVEIPESGSSLKLMVTKELREALDSQGIKAR